MQPEGGRWEFLAAQLASSTPASVAARIRRPEKQRAVVEILPLARFGRGSGERGGSQAGSFEKFPYVYGTVRLKPQMGVGGDLERTAQREAARHGLGSGVRSERGKHGMWNPINWAVKSYRDKQELFEAVKRQGQGCEEGTGDVPECGGGARACRHQKAGRKSHVQLSGDLRRRASTRTL